MIDRKIITFTIISICLILIGSILFSQSFTTSKIAEKQKYSYKMDNEVNYTVKLKKNKFFETDTIQKNRTYITDIVDDINMEFNYNYKIDKNADISYTYRIVSVVNIAYAGNEEAQKNLWTKEYELVPAQNLNVSNGNEFNIKETVIIDYDNYNAQVANYREKYKVPITATLQVKLIVYSDAEVLTQNKEHVSEQSGIEVKMNLLRDAFLIEENYKANDYKSVVEAESVNSNTNYVLILLGMLSFIIAASIIANEVITIKKKYLKTEFKMELNRLIRKYGEIVAEIIAPIDMENLKIIDVKDFEQMLDVEEELRMPILFYETKPDEEGEFVIIYDNIAYRYIIKG